MFRVDLALILICSEEDHAGTFAIEVDLNLGGSVRQMGDGGGKGAPNLVHGFLLSNIAEGMAHRGEDTDHALACVGVDLFVTFKA